MGRCCLVNCAEGKILYHFGIADNERQRHLDVDGLGPHLGPNSWRRNCDSAVSLREHVACVARATVATFLQDCKKAQLRAPFRTIRFLTYRYALITRRERPGLKR